jgi:hypothetical protein
MVGALPHGWVPCTAPSGRVYFADHNQRRTHWELPKGFSWELSPADENGEKTAETVPTESTRSRASAEEATRMAPSGGQEAGGQEVPLPAGWAAATSTDGRTYYVDHNTQHTHWELPSTAPASAASHSKNSSVTASSLPPRIDGATNALHEAAKKGATAAVERMMNQSMWLAQKDALDPGGRTALIWAADHGHVGCVGLLLRFGAEVNVRDKSGNSALTMASKNLRAGCVNALLAAGADRSQVAASPAQLPAEYKGKAVASGGWIYLDQHGAKQGPFLTQKMREWFRGGLLKPDLLVKRESESGPAAYRRLDSRIEIANPKAEQVEQADFLQQKKREIEEQSSGTTAEDGDAMNASSAPKVSASFLLGQVSAAYAV